MNTRSKFRNLIDALAKSVLAASDEEIIAEFMAQGRNPAYEAKRVRRLLLTALNRRKVSKTRLS